jgi:FKBP-type peptidyl-prolyl cis-trans isomerase
VASTFWSAGRASAAPTKAEKEEAARTARQNNERIRSRNAAPKDFPTFVRDGFDVQVITPDGGGYVKQDNGMFYKQFAEGKGDRFPMDGDQVTFDYEAFNENGGRIDSSYQKNQPASIRLGPGSTLIPGLDIAIKSMTPGEQRRVVVPPDLGPPVGPSTFFSAKQWEVFDIALRSIKKCERKSVVFTSIIQCEE